MVKGIKEIDWKLTVYTPTKSLLFQRKKEKSYTYFDIKAENQNNNKNITEGTEEN